MTSSVLVPIEPVEPRMQTRWRRAEEVIAANPTGDCGALPTTLRDLLLARIDELPESTRELLRTAAVIGRRFPHTLLAAVCDRTHDDLFNDLRIAVEQQVLVPQIDVRIRPDAAARLGLTPGDIRRAATTLVKGLKVGELSQVIESPRGFHVLEVREKPGASAVEGRARGGLDAEVGGNSADHNRTDAAPAQLLIRASWTRSCAISCSPTMRPGVRGFCVSLYGA